MPRPNRTLLPTVALLGSSALTRAASMFWADRQISRNAIVAAWGFTRYATRGMKALGPDVAQRGANPPHTGGATPNYFCQSNQFAASSVSRMPHDTAATLEHSYRRPCSLLKQSPPAPAPAPAPKVMEFEVPAGVSTGDVVKVNTRYTFE